MFKQNVYARYVAKTQRKHLVFLMPVVENIRNRRNVNISRGMIEHDNIVALFQVLYGYLGSVSNGYQGAFRKTAAVVFVCVVI